MKEIKVGQRVLVDFSENDYAKDKGVANSEECELVGYIDKHYLRFAVVKLNRDIKSYSYHSDINYESDKEDLLTIYKEHIIKAI